MTRAMTYQLGLLAIVACMGCAPSPKSGKGFTLPEGDLGRGEAAYVSLQCNACHTITGVEQLATMDGAEPEISVSLGGKVSRIKTYGELVTGIINPSHKLASGYPKNEIAMEGESRMRNYNDVMTVSQLTDLVAFLQSKYELMEYEPTAYPVYSPY